MGTNHARIKQLQEASAETLREEAVRLISMGEGEPIDVNGSTRATRLFTNALALMQLAEIKEVEEKPIQYAPQSEAD